MRLFLTAIALLQASAILPPQHKMVTQNSHDKMARGIVTTLKPSKGERVILRFDPETLPELEPVLRKQFEAAGAAVDTIKYGPSPISRRNSIEMMCSSGCRPALARRHPRIKRLCLRDGSTRERAARFIFIGETARARPMV